MFETIGTHFAKDTISGMREFIVIGASVRALAFSALRAGFMPYAIDLFADRDLAAVCDVVRIHRYPSEIATAMIARPAVPWIYTGGLENYPALIARLAKLRPLVGTSAAAVRAAREPVRFGEAVREAGLIFPEIGHDWIDGQWLVKRKNASGGLGVRFAMRSARRLQRGAYLQRYVEGEPVSAVFVAAGCEVVLLGVTRQLLGRDFALRTPFVYAGNIGPLSISNSEKTQLRRLGGVLTNRFHLAGLFNVDLIRNKEGLWPLEVNPRYSASVEILERGLDVKALKMHVDACETGSLPTAPKDFAKMYGKAVVYSERAGNVPQSLELVARERNDGQIWPEIADLPQTGEALKSGQPVVTVFANGASVEQIQEKLRRQVANIQKMLLGMSQPT